MVCVYIYLKSLGELGYLFSKISWIKSKVLGIVLWVNVYCIGKSGEIMIN